MLSWVANLFFSALIQFFSGISYSIAVGKRKMILIQENTWNTTIQVCTCVKYVEKPEEPFVILNPKLKLHDLYLLQHFLLSIALGFSLLYIWQIHSVFTFLLSYFSYSFLFSNVHVNFDVFFIYSYDYYFFSVHKMARCLCYTYKCDVRQPKSLHFLFCFSLLFVCCAQKMRYFTTQFSVLKIKRV